MEWSGFGRSFAYLVSCTGDNTTKEINTISKTMEGSALTAIVFANLYCNSRLPIHCTRSLFDPIQKCYG